jgi:hypothetical protein
VGRGCPTPPRTVVPPAGGVRRRGRSSSSSARATPWAGCEGRRACGRPCTSRGDGGGGGGRARGRPPGWRAGRGRRSRAPRRIVDRPWSTQCHVVPWRSSGVETQSRPARHGGMHTRPSSRVHADASGTVVGSRLRCPRSSGRVGPPARPRAPASPPRGRARGHARGSSPGRARRDLEDQRPAHPAADPSTCIPRYIQRRPRMRRPASSAGSRRILVAHIRQCTPRRSPAVRGPSRRARKRQKTLITAGTSE